VKFKLEDDKMSTYFNRCSCFSHLEVGCVVLCIHCYWASEIDR
jgi:hypothetical protein